MDSPDADAEGPVRALRAFGSPTAAAAVLVVAYLLVPLTGLSPGFAAGLRRALAVLLVGVAAWLAIRLVRVVAELLLARFRVDVRDNLRAREVHTQIEIARKIATVAVWFVAVALALMMFPELRRVGAGLLASAGVAGVVLGIAAQKTLGNLIAGFQMAITQPIRLDDAVVIEGEWGWIEEITLTYVVVRIWDLRRLVVPISYFMEKPIQNWTRTSASILGSVYLYVDYEVAVEDIRRKLEEIVEASPHWDGEVWRLHVTEARERCVELRALVSAADSPTAWELRCEVREKLLAWLQEEHPEGLPRVRASVEQG